MSFFDIIIIILVFFYVIYSLTAKIEIRLTHWRFLDGTNTLLKALSLSVFCRLLILVFLVTWLKGTTTDRVEGRSLSSGLPLRHCITTSTPPAVTCGAMGWCSLRYGHWDTSRSKICQSHKWARTLTDLRTCQSHKWARTLRDLRTCQSHKWAHTLRDLRTY